jgi:hypothetical protein
MATFSRAESRSRGLDPRAALGGPLRNPPPPPPLQPHCRQVSFLPTHRKTGSRPYFRDFLIADKTHINTSEKRPESYRFSFSVANTNSFLANLCPPLTGIQKYSLSTFVLSMKLGQDMFLIHNKKLIFPPWLRYQFSDLKQVLEFVYCFQRMGWICIDVLYI